MSSSSLYEALDLAAPTTAHADVVAIFLKRWFSAFPDTFIGGRFTAYFAGRADNFEDVNISVPCRSDDVVRQMKTDIAQFFQTHVPIYPYKLSEGFRYCDDDDDDDDNNSARSTTTTAHKLDIAVYVSRPHPADYIYMEYGLTSVVRIVKLLYLNRSRWIMGRDNMGSAGCLRTVICIGHTQRGKRYISVCTPDRKRSWPWM